MDINIAYRKDAVMNTLRSFFGTSKGPYKNKSSNVIYNLVFCDDVALYSMNRQSAGSYPWDILVSMHTGVSDLEKIIHDDCVESRVKLLAYHQLRTRHVSISTKELLGVVIEIAFDTGLDVLAVYRDGAARYINQSGKIIIQDAGDNASNSIIKELLLHAENVVDNIGPWYRPRLPHPEKGMARMTFLVSDGVYLGQGPIGTLFDDKMGKPVFQAGTKLVQYLIGKS